MLVLRVMSHVWTGEGCVSGWREGPCSWRQCGTSAGSRLFARVRWGSPTRVGGNRGDARRGWE